MFWVGFRASSKPGIHEKQVTCGSPTVAHHKVLLRCSMCLRHESRRFLPQKATKGDYIPNWASGPPESDMIPLPGTLPQVYMGKLLFFLSGSCSHPPSMMRNFEGLKFMVPCCSLQGAGIRGMYHQAWQFAILIVY